MPERMHEDQFELDEALVRSLVAHQFPQWADLPLAEVAAASTVNAIYRLGNGLAVRLPIRPGQAGQFERDRRWLPRFAPHLPLAIPEPVAAGEPTEAYPSEWAIYRWLPGRPATEASLEDPGAAADALAAFIRALQAIDASDGPGPSAANYQRGAPLAPRDQSARRGLVALEGLIDVDAATEVWEAALSAPAWEGGPVWIHGDLMPGNLLVQDGRLHAVIDFGALGVGDPACDTIPAWTLLPTEVRGRFRDALGVDEATWTRGRGWALWIALVGLPYYRDSNPGFTRVLHRIVEAVIHDPVR
ncbi:MAG: aminoglycoside phosphotransferase family protein [Dehalococcoidia bacterium]